MKKQKEEKNVNVTFTISTDRRGGGNKIQWATCEPEFSQNRRTVQVERNLGKPLVKSSAQRESAKRIGTVCLGLYPVGS